MTEERDKLAGAVVEATWQTNSTRYGGTHDIRRGADAIEAAREGGVAEYVIERAVRLGQQIADDDRAIGLDEEIALREAGEIADTAADSDACGPFDPLRVRTFRHGGGYRLWCFRHVDHTEGLHATEWRAVDDVPLPFEYGGEPTDEQTIGAP